MKKVQLITDGSCIGNPGPGGWACILRYEGQKRDLTGCNPQTTNKERQNQRRTFHLPIIRHHGDSFNQKCAVLLPVLCAKSRIVSVSSPARIAPPLPLDAHAGVGSERLRWAEGARVR